MNKLILTADDFGVVPSINEGITELVQKGLVNSVQVFTNYKDSLQNTKKLIKDAPNSQFELGVHLTITSGSPLTDKKALKPILDRKGNFSTFDELGSGANSTAIYHELKEQINVLRKDAELGPKLTHLTCHHDSLWFYPEYTKQLIKVSNEFDLPFRNPKSFPPKRDKMYYTVVVPILQFIKLGWSDAKLIKETYHLRKEGYFPNEDLVYKAPHYMDSRHYGPIPGTIILPEKKADWIIEKQQKLQMMLQKAMVSGGPKTVELIEFMFHVRKGAIGKGHKEYKQEIEDTGYGGINPKYFDSRVIEFEAIRRHETILKDLLKANAVALGSWRECAQQILKKN